MNDEPEIFQILHKLRYDLTAAQAKVTDALNCLANLSLPSQKPRPYTCPHDGFAFATEARLNEHLANVHDGQPT